MTAEYGHQFVLGNMLTAHILPNDTPIADKQCRRADEALLPSGRADQQRADQAACDKQNEGGDEPHREVAASACHGVLYRIRDTHEADQIVEVQLARLALSQ